MPRSMWLEQIGEPPVRAAVVPTEAGWGEFDSPVKWTLARG